MPFVPSNDGERPEKRRCLEGGVRLARPDNDRVGSGSANRPTVVPSWSSVKKRSCTSGESEGCKKVSLDKEGDIEDGGEDTGREEEGDVDEDVDEVDDSSREEGGDIEDGGEVADREEDGEEEDRDEVASEESREEEREDDTREGKGEEEDGLLP